MFVVHEEIQLLLTKFCKDFDIPPPTYTLHETKIIQDVQYKRYRVSVPYSGIHTSLEFVGRYGKNDYDTKEDVAVSLLLPLLDTYDRKIRHLNYYHVEALEEELWKAWDKNTAFEIENGLLRLKLDDFKME